MHIYLGTSIQYPFKLINGSPNFISGKENIKQSIEHILSNSKGQRYFLPEYGSRLEEMMFEQNDEVLKGMLRLFIKEALDAWEVRIKFKNVSFEQGENIILCNVIYKILMSNEIDSYIFPFYRKLNF